MITKQKTTQFTTSDGGLYASLNEAKERELQILIGKHPVETGKPKSEALCIVECAVDAIKILRLGLPRKPRTVKPKSVKSKKPAAVTQPA